MKKPTEPSAESLEEMPEINDVRFKRRPGRGHHAHRSTGEIVTIDPDLWSHFGSAVSALRSYGPRLLKTIPPRVPAVA